MAEGFEENAEFFTLTYETPVAVSHQSRLRTDRAAAVAARRQSKAAHRQSCPTSGWDGGRHLRAAGRIRRATTTS